MVSQNSPTSSCWAVIVMGKEANFFPFHCKFLHEFNQLSNKKTLPWGKREKKEVILLWSWEVEDEQENKVQRKTTFEIWLLFQRSCGLEEERSGFVWREDSPKYLSELLLSVWCLYESYFCEVVVDGIFSLETQIINVAYIVFFLWGEDSPRFCLKFLCWFWTISFICVS